MLRLQALREEPASQACVAMCLPTWVRGVAGGVAQDRLEAQEVLLAHAAGLLEVLPATELCKLEGNHLQVEQGVGVSPAGEQYISLSGHYRGR